MNLLEKLFLYVFKFSIKLYLLFYFFLHFMEYLRCIVIIIIVTLYYNLAYSIFS